MIRVPIRLQTLGAGAGLVLGGVAQAQSGQLRQDLVERISPERDPASAAESRLETAHHATGMLSVMPTRLTEKPWELTLGTGAGYDTNPTGSRNAEGSAFAEFSATAAYTFDLHPQTKTTFRAEYGADYKFYEGTFADARELDQTLTGVLRHSFDAATTGSLKIQDTIVHVAEDPFLNRLEVAPSVRRRLNAVVSVDASYSYSSLNYLFEPADPRRDPDADRHTVGGALVLNPAGPLEALKPYLESLAIGYGRTFNLAQGSDYDFDGDKVSLKVSKVRAWKDESLYLDLGYTHEWNDYKHPNSGSAIGLSRYDSIHRANIQLNWKLDPWGPVTPTLSVRYDYRRQDSNLASKRYDESTFFAGLALDF